MKKKTGNHKQLNKGFTLVEVLVAITVLSIILVPLLSAFVVAANTNAKARQTLRATTLAQNVMEELKAYSLEDSANQYNGLGSGNAVVAKAKRAFETVLGDDMVHRAVTIDEDDVVTGRADGRYDFVLEGVSQESAKFDVEVQIRKPKATGSGAYNMVNIVSMNRSDCAYFAQSASSHNNVGTEYVRRRNTTDMTAAKLMESVTRTITIDINSAVDGEKVIVTYDYMINDSMITADNRRYTESATVFDSYAKEEKLKAVYVYYYPLYPNPGETAQRDTIVINNTANLPVDVYLIRMNDQTANSYSIGSYRPTVDLRETVVAGEIVSKAKICTNMETDTGVRSYICKYNGVETTTKIRTTTLSNPENVQNMYDVTIKVYQHDADAVDTSSGAAVITLKESKKIATFTGTVLEKAD